jgi:hypothetical protein
MTGIEKTTDADFASDKKLQRSFQKNVINVEGLLYFFIVLWANVSGLINFFRRGMLGVLTTHTPSLFFSLTYLRGKIRLIECSEKCHYLKN